MDVALSIRKHLPRQPQPTLQLIDNYCARYQDLFPEVRNYECWKWSHLGLIAPIPRKSLPEIAKVVGVNSAQSLHHFIANSPWSVEELRKRRLKQTLQALKGEAITVIIDETGDRKKAMRPCAFVRRKGTRIKRKSNRLCSPTISRKYWEN